MPRPCAVEIHGRCYNDAPTCGKGIHQSEFVAAKVNLHGTRPWHPYFRALSFLAVNVSEPWHKAMASHFETTISAIDFRGRQELWHLPGLGRLLESVGQLD